MDLKLHTTRWALSFAMVATSLCVPSTARAGTPFAKLQRASFSGHAVSLQVRAVADWTVQTRDNQNLPFVIVDKVGAQLFLFDRNGTLKAATSVLLGLARGDVSPPGVGDRKLSLITPAERITPAGRFVASKGIDLGGQDIVWVDYNAAIAIHRASDIKPGATARDRLARLASASPRDKRISYGCINVSEPFYDTFIRPVFSASSGIVYILPEASPLAAIFPLHTVGRALGAESTGPSSGS
jgi:hypothetical protein